MVKKLIYLPNLNNIFRTDLGRVGLKILKPGPSRAGLGRAGPKILKSEPGRAEKLTARAQGCMH
jgi:hypothetical protein